MSDIKTYPELLAAENAEVRKKYLDANNRRQQRLDAILGYTTMGIDDGIDCVERELAAMREREGKP